MHTKKDASTFLLGRVYRAHFHGRRAAARSELAAALTNLIPYARIMHIILLLLLYRSRVLY